ncbi:tRNA (adenosine(37)-N6)-threonylcarbamoyltransferase complex dimerization subunit type 1 TsaB [Flavobacteriaceae bacterium]|nr:tRNA (adenosine(37)-N6)-threonylcarbamoyltransferase complex dimerization subunit type 1 TsaB [Flavobacteriaceae bacterium]
MAIILSIETSTKNCSVCIAQDNTIIAIKEVNDGNYSHAERLHVFIEELLEENNIDKNNIDAIAVGKGPGSYTGLRIGVSTAKGLAYALDKPLIGVHTLKAIATSLNIESGFIVPMIDARRLEVFSAVYNTQFELLRAIKAEIIDENSFEDILKQDKVYFLGDGAAKCKDILTHSNATFIENVHPSAKEVSKLAYEKFLNKDFEDTAYFEPFYLKDFIVTPSKKKSLTTK